jgi:hypothetical protein
VKLSVELAPNGGLSVYLPGALHPLQLRPGSAEEILIAMLRSAQEVEKEGRKPALGTVAAPTQAQLEHWQNHTSRNVRGCPWCKPTPNLGFEALEEFLPKEKKNDSRRTNKNPKAFPK